MIAPSEIYCDGMARMINTPARQQNAETRFLRLRSLSSEQNKNPMIGITIIKIQSTHIVVVVESRPESEPNNSVNIKNGEADVMCSESMF